MAIRKTNLRYRPCDPEFSDFVPGFLAVIDKPPSPLPRTVLYSCLSLFALLLLWAAIGKLDVIAVAEGKLVPETYVKIVQSAEAGIVKEILVQEGDKVTSGQILMRMDTTIAQADTEILTRERLQHALQLRRIEAELNDVPLMRKANEPEDLFRQIDSLYHACRNAYHNALAQAQAERDKAQAELAAARQVLLKLRGALPAYQAQEMAWNKLGKNHLAPQLQVIEKQRQRLEQEQGILAQERTVEALQVAVLLAEKRLVQVSSNYRQALLNEKLAIEAKSQIAEQEWAKQQHKNTQLELKAPQAGIIKELATHTLGTVVKAGTVMMTVVPLDENLLAEVNIKNEDIGFVRRGQSAKMKLAAYPFQTYGLLGGNIMHVSADASGQPTMEQPNSGNIGTVLTPMTYKATIRLDKQQLELGRQQFPVTSGMQVTAEILQGQRTILEYLFAPVQEVAHNAFGER